MWVLTDLDQTNTETTITLTITTDIPVHLWLRWSTLPIPSRNRTRRVRGILVNCGLTYIFPAGQIVEQDEPGDTLTHTFTITNLQCSSLYGYALIESLTTWVQVPAVGPLLMSTAPCPPPPGPSEVMAHITIKSGSPIPITATQITVIFTWIKS